MDAQPRNTESARSHPQKLDRQQGGAVRWIKRTALAVVGGALLVRGLRQRSLRGIAMVFVGGWILFRGLGGTAEDQTRPIGVRSRATEEELRMSEEGTRPRQEGTELDTAGTRTAEKLEVSRTIFIDRPADDLYEIWRDPEQFSQIMGHFADVVSSGDDRLRWTVHGPRDRDLSMETRIVAAEPGEFVRWKTTEETIVSSEGSIRFRPAAGDRGTEVTLSISFDPPGGELINTTLKRLDGVPKSIAGTALRRFKSLAESGEIPSLGGNPSGRGKGDLL